ncbi:MAG: glycerol kinase GlpK [Thermoanaerobaculia bacterium]
MQTVLAIDQGTTSSRAILFDRGGTVVATAQREFQQIFPQPGWVEHDANEIWSTQIAVTAEVMARVPEARVEAIGITNQRETTVLWDRITGEPVANAIVWQDRRTAPFCDALRLGGYEPLFRERTGLLLDPYFSGTKIRWLLDNVAGAREKAQDGRLAFGTIDSWLVWKLTGGAAHVTDVTNASRTLLFDIRRGVWDDELLEILGVPRAMLPIVCSSSELVGETANGRGVPAGIPIAGIAGDQQAALFGQRCTAPGMAKNTYGTGCFIVMNTGAKPVESTHGLLSTIAWSLPERATQFAIEGSVFVGGAVVQWLRDQLGIIRAASDVEALAASVPDSGGVVFVPAFTGLGAPHWDAYARGAILGITRGTTAAHLARAALESIALQTADVLDAMRSDSELALREVRVDGAASKNDLLMQMQADIAGVRVVRSNVSEATALGAAYLAGLAVKFWDSEADIDALWEESRAFEPRQDASALRERWRRAIERVKQWAV